ncbi:MAG: copper resistance protein NlpE N-terminal domain-containing protein [Muribaculaceae bacterium]|nr:copper resistance protein NlpE N-terminal domain-containing protein [Muribaculaceae bacterium]MDE5595458.1 copper resistance protein NlpE N-terminal domain-containing protein [Muribaculaceae bacterium]MDE6702306.1 copper resistance protein NlpE N-terminal domain-containing protein [Muribaculaceae bacterium]
MKKLLFVATAVIALFGMAACNGKKAAETEEPAAEATAVKAAYTGVLPAADCDGVWYTLQLNDGKYDMIETYFALDTAANAGINEILSVKSEGTVETIEKGDFSYIKLTPSTEDAAICFLNATDSTIIMLNAELETPAAPDFYTLNIVK